MACLGLCYHLHSSPSSIKLYKRKLPLNSKILFRKVENLKLRASLVMVSVVVGLVNKVALQSKTNEINFENSQKLKEMLSSRADRQVNNLRVLLYLKDKIFVRCNINIFWRSMPKIWSCSKEVLRTSTCIELIRVWVNLSWFIF